MRDNSNIIFSILFAGFLFMISNILGMCFQYQAELINAKYVSYGIYAPFPDIKETILNSSLLDFVLSPFVFLQTIKSILTISSLMSLTGIANIYQLYCELLALFNVILTIFFRNNFLGFTTVFSIILAILLPFLLFVAYRVNLLIILIDVYLPINSISF